MNLQEIFDRLEVIPTALVRTHEPSGQAEPFRTAAEALRFMLSGHATVTFQGKASRFTFKVSAPKVEGTEKTDYNSPVRFVALMNGPDNEGNFQYLGYIKRGVYFYGHKAKISADAPAAKAFDWTYRNLARGIMPAGLEIWHEGKCGRCGRKLTVPESVASGFGPECINHIH